MRIEASPDETTLTAAARLHRVCLRGSIVTLLGDAYARAFYRFAASSDRERVFVALDEDARLVGVVVVTIDYPGLTRRLLFRTPLVLSLLLRPWLALRLAAGRARGYLSGGVANELPEVLAIFVGEPDRGRRVGKELLACVETYLSAIGVRKYSARTRDRPDNRAVGFYLREGFDRIGRTHTDGRWFLLMAKTIEPAR